MADSTNNQAKKEIPEEERVQSMASIFEQIDAKIAEAEQYGSKSDAPDVDVELEMNRSIASIESKRG